MIWIGAKDRSENPNLKIIERRLKREGICSILLDDK